jgi:hypothetical protein
MPSDRRRAGEVRLDHLDVPGLVRCDPMSMEEPFEISEEEAVLVGELADAAV